MNREKSFTVSEDFSGSDVYSTTSGEKIGTIDRVLVDSVAGRPAYAEVSFGGFLGLGESHHQLPWGTLQFDPVREAYVTSVTAEQLENAPDFEGDVWEVDAQEDEIHKYYGTPVYWGASAGADSVAGVESYHRIDNLERDARRRVKDQERH